MKVNFWRAIGLSVVTTVAIAISSKPILSYQNSMSAFSLNQFSLAQNPAETPEAKACPEDVRELTALLLKDLPAYSNRVIQRTQDLNQTAGIENYIITAGEAEYEPLNLPRLQYNPIDDEDPEQIFFTVLERQYIDNQIVEIQTYHWLFLTQTDSGWRTVIMFSRFGNSVANKPPAPPRETTNGIIGRAVQLWLRDCRAGTITAK